jgi:simple sugar transport system substrate-binding protein
MKITTHAKAAAVLAVITMGMTGCAKAGSSDDKSSDSTQSSSSGGSGKGGTFVLIRHGLPSDSFWQPVQKGFTESGKIYGVKTSFQATGNNPNDEAKAIDQAVAQKVDGIAVTLADAGAEGPAIERATKAGIPVITINSGSGEFASVGSLTHVGQDETIAGEGAGTKFKDSGAKKLLCVLHQQGNLGLEARCNGAKETFGAANVKTQYVPGTNDGPGTESALKATLQTDKSIDAVLTLDPDISQLAKSAIAASGSKAKLGTFDLSKDVLAGIKAGDIEFAVNQQPYLQGSLPVSFLAQYMQSGLMPGGGKPVLTGPSFVEKSNVDKISACVDAGRC